MTAARCMPIDHIGYAVKHMEESVQRLRSLGFAFEEPIDDEDRNIKVCFGQQGEYRIELVAPLDRKEPSPVDLYLKKVGCTPYHFCFRSEDMEKDIEQLEQDGYRLIIEPRKATAFSVRGGVRRVAFLWAEPAGLIEIVDAQAANLNREQ